MKFYLFLLFVFLKIPLFSQSNGGVFIEEKLRVILSNADEDLETILTICKLEDGLTHQDRADENYTFTYQSPEQDYLLNVTFYFNKMFAKKIKIEITPADNDDMNISSIVSRVLKKKFKIQKQVVADATSQTIKYFLSDNRYSGILAVNHDTKKIDLVLSIKTD